jgi:hypothetical protein
MGFDGILSPSGERPDPLAPQDWSRAGPRLPDETGEQSPIAHFLDAAAFCFAHRSFCAAEIFARAAADIFRRPPLPDPFGRPGPRFATVRAAGGPAAPDDALCSCPELREQLRCLVAQLRQLLDNGLPLTQPAVGLRPRRAEHPSQVFREFFNLLSRDDAVLAMPPPMNARMIVA